MKVLHVAAEAWPLVKTGGLADVVAALPAALVEEQIDARLLLPGFPSVLGAIAPWETVLEAGPLFGALRVRLLRGRMPDSRLPVYALDAPYRYQRDGNPYRSADGHDWPDNLQRFALLGWVGAQLATGQADPGWAADLLHAHDWHAALACAYLHEPPVPRPPSVFTIHNLAYQGLFALQDWPLLGLPSRLLSPAGLEFHGQLSFMKAGLKLARAVTTVSPTYAREIATPESGCGLDGVIRGRGHDVRGILNGIDTRAWDPARDAHIAQPYDTRTVTEGKQVCREALQHELGLQPDGSALLVAVVSRLTGQKGVDLLLQALPELVGRGAQFAIQGQGDASLEAALLDVQAAYPGRVAVRIGYDESRAHRLVAGADVMAVPSRFEPCGLTQLYAMRYGTIPVVHRVGGLADTVIDADAHALASGLATGVCFDRATAAAFASAVLKAQALRRQPQAWRSLQAVGMAQDLGWKTSARAYAGLYAELCAGPAAPPGAGHVPART